MITTRTSLVSIILVLSLCGSALHARQEQSPSAAPAGEPVANVETTVKSIADALRAGYVFPEIGEQMATDLLARFEKGEYSNVRDERALAEQITEDLRAISNDKHLGVGVRPPASAASAPMRGPSIEQMRAHNFGFKKVEHLDQNIGYLKFDFFGNEDEAKETAAAALGFLAHCDAIIIDLRENGGGNPDMIRYITSYFFDSPTLLNRMVDRNGNVVQEFTTLETVPGRRFDADVAIFVLTSNYTFSGAEEFSYNLKNLKRATIIGETTGGGAHPVRGERINDRFVLRVPFMRAQNPITMTNWEGVGVEPDIKVAADEALGRAIEEAKKAAAPRQARKSGKIVAGE